MTPLNGSYRRITAKHVVAEVGWTNPMKLK